MIEAQRGQLWEMFRASARVRHELRPAEELYLVLGEDAQNELWLVCFSLTRSAVEVVPRAWFDDPGSIAGAFTRRIA